MYDKGDLERNLATASRHQRYRLAGKTLRYHVYQGIEATVAVVFVLLVILVWFDAPAVLVVGTATLAGILSLMHHVSTALRKPWLPLAAASEAAVVWFVYEQWLTGIFQVPFFAAFCVFIFTVRYWQRGEREVRESALAVLQSKERSNKPMEPTA